MQGWQNKNGNFKTRECAAGRERPRKSQRREVSAEPTQPHQRKQRLSVGSAANSMSREGSGANPVSLRERTHLQHRKEGS